MSENSTKKRILEAAETIMLVRSFHSVGLKQILDAALVPKGSFYHYFNSKENFGVEMIRSYMQQVTQNKQRMLLGEDVEEKPLKKIFVYLDSAIDAVKACLGQFPCLAVKLASEVSTLSESMRVELARSFEEWIHIIKTALEEVQAVERLPEDFDCESEAQLIQDLLAGSIQRSVINCSAEPIQNAVSKIKASLTMLSVW